MTEPKNTMPGAWQCFHDCANGLSITFSYASSRPYAPDLDRIWFGIVFRWRTLVARSELRCLEELVDWSDTAEQPRITSSTFRVKEKNLLEVIERLEAGE